MALRSAGSDSKDTSSSASTAQRANTTSAPQAAASVKAASPTTSVSSHAAGSGTQDTRGTDTSASRGNSQAFSGSTSGIAAAANIGGAQTGNRGVPDGPIGAPYSPTSGMRNISDGPIGSPHPSTGPVYDAPSRDNFLTHLQTGVGSSNIEDRRNPNLLQSYMEWAGQQSPFNSTAPHNQMPFLPADGKFDSVNQDRPTWEMLQDQVDMLPRMDSVNQDRPTWEMLQDQLDQLQPGVARGTTQSQAVRNAQLTASDSPGIGGGYADFSKNVRNGSMGEPGAVGYGTDGAPVKISPGNSVLLGDAANGDPFSGIHNIQAVMGNLGGLDLAGLAHALNGPYLARQAQNGGVAPFEGPVDTAGMIRQLNAPYYRSTATPGPMDVPGERTTFGQLDDWVNDTSIPARSMPQIGADNAASWVAAVNGAPTGDRLPSERRVKTSVVTPAYAADPSVQADDRRPDGSYVDPLTAIADATSGVGLPRRDPRGYGDVFATDGQVTTADGTVITPGSSLQPGYNGGVHGSSKSADKPSTWDKVVDNTGKLLSHTGLGALVSGMFPDLWNGMGDAFKGVGGNPGSGTTPIYNPADDTEIADRTHSSRTGGALLDFIDANGNGIDDRYESSAPATAGIAAAANPDAAGYSGNQFRSNRYATFPDMPPYRPGVDNEWNYFHDHLARGGVVGYADRDPRVGMIADAEDALHRGDHQHASITQFVDTFGPKALEHLNTNVLAGHRMRAGLPARQISGPGGPTDDAVPAMIDGKHPAALSSGEVVIPVSAVEGAGDGDPRVGADRLMQLSQRLTAK